MESDDSKKKLILLDFWPSPFCMRVKIALLEKGITDNEIKHEDVTVGKSSLLLEMNPVHNKIPVLIHDGKPVCESMTIVEYIDEVWFHRAPLLPSDPYVKSRAKFWANYIDQKLIPAGCKLSRAKGEANEAKNEFLECLKLLEIELGDNLYFGGSNFGYLDIALIPDFSWFYTYETCAGFSIERECPTLIQWANRCLERHSVRSSLPHHLRVYDYARARNVKLGLA